MFDLLLVGGTVVDPSQGLHAVRDIAVHDGRIAALAETLQHEPAKRVIDLTGRFVTPGLIDIHTHVAHGVSHQSVHPDIAGVRAGVTTVVDAGSTGSATFDAFPQHILPNCHTTVLPFLHIGQTGLATHPDIVAKEDIDLDATLSALEANKGLIRGIKARMVTPALEIFGMEMPRLAGRAAHESGLPLMVHIGDSEKRCDPNVIRELLQLLEPGDIVTHLFTANPGGVLDANGKLVPETREALDRGVWLD
ncbi:MAG TPA: amidohydrolase family protein, partial [Chloroflexota bacterium]|nr:amidohydrolase family protein [Chloroflexota bacterium]